MDRQLSAQTEAAQIGRRAFVHGAAWAARQTSPGMTDARKAAAECYPLPPRPRVVEWAGGNYRWNSEEARLEVEQPAGWERSKYNTTLLYEIPLALLTIIVDLSANPTEEVAE